MTVQQLKQLHARYQRDRRTEFVYRHTASPASYKAWHRRMKADGPLIILGGIVTLCEQGATVRMDGGAVTVTLGSFTGRSAVPAEHSQLYANILRPWVS